MFPNGMQDQPSAVRLEDFDLDTFLDTYLVQLTDGSGTGQLGVPPNVNNFHGNMQGPNGMLGMNMPSTSGMPMQGQLGNLGYNSGLASGFGGGLGMGMQNHGMGMQSGLGMGMQGGMGNLGGMGSLGGMGGGMGNPSMLGPSPYQPSGGRAGQGSAGFGGVGRATAQAAAPAAAAPPAAASRGRAAAAPAAAPAATAAPPQKATRRGRSNSRAKEPEPEPSDDEDDSMSDDSDSSQEKPKTRRKRGSGNAGDDVDNKHKALQEKNRRAQRRFRERQKNKLTELHQQIEELTSKVSSLQTENAQLHSRTSILEKVLDMRNEQIQVMQETKEPGGFPGSEDDLSTLPAASGSLVVLTSEMVKELTSESIYKLYQQYVKELSCKLVEVQREQDQEGSPAFAELEKLVKDLSMMIMRLGVVKPLETRKFIVVSRQYLGSSEAEVIQLWKSVMKAIDLTPQQQREVVELKRMFLQKIEPIMEERKHLNVQIQSNLPHDTFHTKNALTYIKAHEAVIKLRDNLRAEQHVVLEFAVAVFRGVFRPQQMAQLLVKCYPAVPDALGIASALAAELGEPDSLQTQQLAMQLGGYTMAGQSAMPMSNYLSIHPGMFNPAGGGNPSNLPQLPPGMGGAGPSRGSNSGVGNMPDGGTGRQMGWMQGTGDSQQQLMSMGGGGMMRMPSDASTGSGSSAPSGSGGLGYQGSVSGPDEGGMNMLAELRARSGRTSAPNM